MTELRRPVNPVEAVLALAAMIVIIVVVWKVGVLGLVLLPLVMAQIVNIIWGHPPANKETKRMGRPADGTQVADSDALEAIISAAKQGDERAWRELVAAIHPFLQTITRQLCQTASHIVPPDELEGIVWFNLYTKGLTKYVSGNFRGWLWRVTQNTLRDELRRLRSRFGEATTHVDIAESDIDETIVLFDWFDGLPAEESFAFFLRYVCNQRWLAIVKAMNIAFPQIAWSRTACQRAADKARARLILLEEDS